MVSIHGPHVSIFGRRVRTILDDLIPTVEQSLSFSFSKMSIKCSNGNHTAVIVFSSRVFHLEADLLERTGFKPGTSGFETEPSTIEPSHLCRT